MKYNIDQSIIEEKFQLAPLKINGKNHNSTISAYSGISP